jgi:hypothetical protein
MQIRDQVRATFFKSAFAILAVLITLVAPTLLRADSARFDLSGPTVRVKVSRDGKSLPISSVANLRGGDRLWIQADLPSTQSARYLLIVAFLQGSTNPPPEDWFTEIETWKREVRTEGTLVTVPQDAQQALLFLTPDTGGAFSTLRSTVRGKPGMFVRASQDLVQASLDRTRIDKFMEEIKKASAGEPGSVAERAGLLSRTLAVKADPKCFDEPANEQSSCLTSNTDHLALGETNNESMVATLTSGASADLVGTLSTTPAAGKGYYSPYVGSAMDIVRLLNGLRTAALQYLPALTAPEKEDLKLSLNSPPSFQNPRSVLVVGLPSVKGIPAQELHPLDAKRVYCMQNSSVVLPVEGAPLVFSTSIAHDFAIRVQNKSGNSIELPALADAGRGGFTIDLHSLQPGTLDPESTGTLHGRWGFDSYQGPSFQFRQAHSAAWSVPESDAASLLAGRQNTLHLRSSSAVCVQQVSAQGSKGKDLNVTWSAPKPDELEVQLPLKDEAPGPLKLQVKQFGLAATDMVSLKVYSEAAHVDGFTIHSGDWEGLLKGTLLDEVSSLELRGIEFVPAKTTAAAGMTERMPGREPELAMRVPSGAAAVALPANENLVAHITLKDGRVLDLQTTVQPPRPKVSLISKTAKQASATSALRFGNQDELAQNGQLSFLLKTEVPDRFPREEVIEVATTDGSANAVLSVENGGLILQDSQSVLAILDPLKNLGPSVFGALQFRPVAKEIGKGDWQPLARLVRIPALREIRCPAAADQQCALHGSNLFLLDSVATDPEFKNAVAVPTGYADSSLNIPRPSGTLLYIKLRDDPATADTVVLPVLPEDYTSR